MYLQPEERERDDEERIFFMASCLVEGEEGDLLKGVPKIPLSLIIYTYCMGGTNIWIKSLN